MDRVVLTTPLGPIPLVGRIGTGADKPALLAIGGVFPPADHLHDLVDAFPEFDVVVGNLPGMRSPLLSGGNSIETFTTAYDHVLQRLFPGQAVVAFGASTGALVAMGLKRAKRIVVAEPFLRTSHLTHFIENVVERLQKNSDANLHKYMKELFGITLDRPCEDRDYRSLVRDLTAPTDVVVGTALLGTPGLPFWPSFTDQSDRALLESNPHVRLSSLPGQIGHNIHATAASQASLLNSIRAALTSVA